MKTKKTILIISFISTITSLILAIIFHVLTLKNSHINFLIDICLGIFSGAILSIFITIVEYLSCRKKNLEKLFNLLCKQRYEFNKIKYFPEHICTEKFKAALHEKHSNEEYKNLGLIDTEHDDAFKSLQEEYLSKENDILNIDDNDKLSIINAKIQHDQDSILKQIDDVIASYREVKYNSYEIGNIWADSSFLFNNTQIQKELSETYQFVKNIEEKYTIANFHFNNYITMSVSPSVVIEYIIELQNNFFQIETDKNDFFELKVYSKFEKELNKIIDDIGFLCYGKKYNPIPDEDKSYLKCAYNFKMKTTNEEKS